jgi:hypothetical protein
MEIHMHGVIMYFAMGFAGLTLLAVIIQKISPKTNKEMVITLSPEMSKVLDAYATEQQVSVQKALQILVDGALLVLENRTRNDDSNKS